MGKRLKASKKRIFWRFGFLDDSDRKYEVLLVHSLLSGKKVIFFDGEQVRKMERARRPALVSSFK